ncbi:MAG: RNA polymerase sigma-70 factor [Bacteroidota bacterium]|nr:RNA polymerase sigma-70 factor [Bacteroidota bacterium]
MTSFDKAAFEQLFRMHFKTLTYFALRYVKDQDTAHEIVQDAFMGLWEKRETIDPERSVTSYLSTSVRNKCLNHLRNTKKFSDELLSLENLPQDAFYEQPLRLTESEITLRILQSTAELPEKCREVFELSRNEHLKYEEIAQRLNISVKTVETQISKALAHFRIRLKEFMPVLIVIICMSEHWN